MNDALGMISHTRYVKATEAVLIETFVRIINRPNGNFLLLRYKQFESVSSAPTTIASGPPNNRNVRNTRASEKLIANFDRGNARLIRGARRTANKTIER